MRELNDLNQTLIDAMAESPGDAAPEPASKARMLGNILNRAKAEAPTGTRTLREDDIPWDPFSEGIERKLLVPNSGDGMETALYRLAPGASFVPHLHTHRETCWVVEGDIMVGDHVVHAGDWHIGEAGVEHPEIVARTRAVLMLHSQMYIGPLTPFR